MEDISTNINNQTLEPRLLSVKPHTREVSQLQMNQQPSVVESKKAIKNRKKGERTSNKQNEIFSHQGSSTRPVALDRGNNGQQEQDSMEHINTELEILIKSCLRQQIPRPKTFESTFYQTKGFLHDDPVEMKLTSSMKLTSIKTSRVFSSRFNIFCNWTSQPLGYISSNFMGDTYNYFEWDQAQAKTILKMTILYKEGQAFGSLYRDTTIYITGSDYTEGKEKVPDLEEIYRSQDKEQLVIRLTTRQPHWDIDKERLCLKFNQGKKHKKVYSSIKNNIFVDSEDKAVMFFFKDSPKTYHVSFGSPLNIGCVYAFILSSLDFKYSSQ